MKFKELRNGYVSLKEMAQATFPASAFKAALQVSRILGKISPEIEVFEQTQLKMYKTAGAVMDGKDIVLNAPKQKEGETTPDYFSRMNDFNAMRDNLLSAMENALDAEIEVSFEPIKISDLRGIELKPIWLFGAAPFVTDDWEK